MSRVDAADGLDRLPWLADEPESFADRGGGDVAAWAVTATVLVAGTAYWMGTNSSNEQFAASQPFSATTTVRLPKARPPQPVQPEVTLSGVPEVKPMVAPPMPVIEGPTRVEPKSVPIDRLQPRPVRRFDRAAGRLVRIGAFASVHQAKKGWWTVAGTNSALKHLPALVVPVRSRRSGRVYYRLQMGTTSQAHSRILCQRMRMLAQSCVVLGGVKNQRKAAR